MASRGKDVYCICKKPYNSQEFMIECSVCKDWFHGSCVDITEDNASYIDQYHCPNCHCEHGPLVLKKRHLPCLELNSDKEEARIGKVRTGSKRFIEELKRKNFRCASELPVISLKGWEATVEYLNENGFTLPILVKVKDGLDLVVPPKTFTVNDVENNVGSMREIDVIDVAKQEDHKMFLREWTDYYTAAQRQKILNVVSLEFSNTKLANFVDPPRLVKEVSWVNNCWPQDEEDPMFIKPEVQRYCLMGMKDSYTDFHIDFGGSSVWYHIVGGQKIFYLIPPTPTNLEIYEEWMMSSQQPETFFADLVDNCYQCTISEGETVFLPSAWIHAVLTPADSLVFGGNFLHSYNIDLQLQVYEMEKRIKTPQKYFFPNFEPLHWFAARSIGETIREYREGGHEVPKHLISGTKTLITHLRDWTTKKKPSENIPYPISHKQLLRDLRKELDQLLLPCDDESQELRNVQAAEVAPGPYFPCGTKRKPKGIKRKKVAWDTAQFFKR